MASDSDSTQKNKQHIIRTTDALWEKVQATARRAGVSDNAYVNRILEYALAHPHPELLGGAIDEPPLPDQTIRLDGGTWELVKEYAGRSARTPDVWMQLAIDQMIGLQSGRGNLFGSAGKLQESIKALQKAVSSLPAEDVPAPVLRLTPEGEAEAKRIREEQPPSPATITRSPDAGTSERRQLEAAQETAPVVRGLSKADQVKRAPKGSR